MGLWVGGVDGLFRFDGLTFERIGPAPTDPGRIVVARLLAARDGYAPAPDTALHSFCHAVPGR